jgi:hypothetical protein
LLTLDGTINQEEKPVIALPMKRNIALPCAVCSLGCWVLANQDETFRSTSIWRHVELVGDKVTSNQAFLPFYSVLLCQPAFHNCSALHCQRAFIYTIHLEWGVRTWTLLRLDAKQGIQDSWRHEVLTAMLLEVQVSWDVTLCHWTVC